MNGPPNDTPQTQASKNSFLDTVEELSKEMNISKAEVLRQSIGLYAEALAQAKQGKIIQFVDENLAKEVNLISSELKK